MSPTANADSAAPDTTGAAATPLVLITGASSGIGQALAAHFARQGWRLALVARRREAIDAWVRAEGLASGRCGIYAADVADAASIGAAAAQCIARQGLPEIVVANAGISVGMDTAQAEDLEVMRETLATNLYGVAATFQPFVQPMRERGRGTLVAIASMAAIRGLPGHGAYCASKAGLVAYCESLRVECRGSGVAVVTLLPGFVATPLTARNPYPMPFLLSAERFAERAYRAIVARARYRVIPWQMAVLARLMRLLPAAWFDPLVAGRRRKPRRR